MQNFATSYSYIKVKGRSGTEHMVPLAEDRRTLPLRSLLAFPGAVGLKYKNTAGIEYALL